MEKLTEKEWDPFIEEFKSLFVNDLNHAKDTFDEMLYILTQVDCDSIPHHRTDNMIHIVRCISVSLGKSVKLNKPKCPLAS